MWIDINEELPKIGERVRVWVPQEKEWYFDTLRQLSNSDGGGNDFTYWYKHNVTHWMKVCENESPLFQFGIKPPNSDIYGK